MNSAKGGEHTKWKEKIKKAGREEAGMEILQVMPEQAKREVEPVKKIHHKIQADPKLVNRVHKIVDSLV